MLAAPADHKLGQIFIWPAAAKAAANVQHWQ
jgi:hypothetical protein